MGGSVRARLAGAGARPALNGPGSVRQPGFGEYRPPTGYEWAGQYRTLELSKGGFSWPPTHRVATNMERFEAGLLCEHTPCRPDALSEVARRMAIVHAELLLIHPFREGNGRLARWLADLMALQAGHRIPVCPFFGRGGTKNRTRYLQAVQKGYVLNYGALTDFFFELLT